MNLMKKSFLSELLILAIFMITLSSHAWSVSNGYIAESYFVFVPQTSNIFKQISLQPELTVDHPTIKGFEVYGPPGLGKYLSQIGVKYQSLKIYESIDKTRVSEYPTYEMIVQQLKNLAQKYSSIMQLSSIGKSVEGRDLWVMKISDNPDVDEVEPEFKYISSMHGDEIVGRELTIQFIADLGKEYMSGNPDIVKFINATELYIMPSMNPDGSEKVQRANANDYDLNRNFPDMLPYIPETNQVASQPNHRRWQKINDEINDDINDDVFQHSRITPTESSTRQSTQQFQPETQLIMNWHKLHNFALSANFHGGAVVMNYAWDSSPNRHPMDAFLQEVALSYSKLNLPMFNSSKFKQGITNGADWYIVRGGMQDWSYIEQSDLQFTIELSDIKYPSYNTIPQYYQENKNAMLVLAKRVQQGAGFFWKNKNINNQVGWVEVFNAANKNLGKFPYRNGEFYKVLPPGRYLYNIYNQNSALLKKLSVSINASFNYENKYVELNEKM